jgi:hypothetical protein
MSKASHRDSHTESTKGMEKQLHLHMYMLSKLQKTEWDNMGMLEFLVLTLIP